MSNPLIEAMNRVRVDADPKQFLDVTQEQLDEFMLHVIHSIDVVAAKQGHAGEITGKDIGYLAILAMSSGVELARSEAFKEKLGRSS